MEIPLQITFKGMESTEAIEDRVRQHASRLERFHDRIMRCHVVVDSPHHHQHRGRLYEVHIHITVPGGDIAVSHDKPGDPKHEDVHMAIRQAFDAAIRQLEDHIRKQRGKVKHHAAPATGRIVKLFPAQQYGFLETPDELQVYFHENSVPDGAFAVLEIGTEVRFVLAEGEGREGPQASTVEPV